MKIAIVSSYWGLKSGGAGVVAFNLAKELLVHGHSVFVVAIENHQFRIEHELPGAQTFYIKIPNIYYQPDIVSPPAIWKRVIYQIIDLYNPAVEYQLNKIISIVNPSVVHVHKMRGLSGAIWPILGNMLPGRVIQTCHDYESMSPQGLLQGRIGNLAANQRWPVRGYQIIRRYLSRNIAYVSAPSQYTLNKILASGLFPNARPVVITNTHGYTSNELSRLRAQKGYRHNNRVNVLFIGRLEAEKGIGLLCQCFRELGKSHPNLRLQIAGWGSLELQLKNVYGGEENIEFLGTVTGKEKEETYRNATITILPSLVPEVFGLVLVESYSFGIPVVASNIGGMAEIVSDGETGWLIEPGNKDEIIRILKMIAEHPEMAMALETNCFSASEKYTLEKITGDYESIYNKIANNCAKNY